MFHNYLSLLAEEEREQFYKAIGYSEDEEYIEFPKEVSAIFCSVNFNQFASM